MPHTRYQFNWRRVWLGSVPVFRCWGWSCVSRWLSRWFWLVPRLALFSDNSLIILIDFANYGVYWYSHNLGIKTYGHGLMSMFTGLAIPTIIFVCVCPSCPLVKNMNLSFLIDWNKRRYLLYPHYLYVTSYSGTQTPLTWFQCMVLPTEIFVLSFVFDTSRNWSAPGSHSMHSAGKPK